MLLASTLFAVAMLPAAAQSPAVICGTVADTKGARLGHVDVVLRSNTGDVVTAVTNENGDYRFATVASGRYTITFTLSGFKKTVRPNLDVREAADVPVDQRLEVSTRPGDTVVADAGRVSVGVTTQSGNGSFSKEITKRGSEQPRPCKER